MAESNQAVDFLNGLLDRYTQIEIAKAGPAAPAYTPTRSAPGGSVVGTPTTGPIPAPSSGGVSAWVWPIGLLAVGLFVAKKAGVI